MSIIDDSFSDFAGMMRVHYSEVPFYAYDGIIHQLFEQYWELCEKFTTIYTNDIRIHIFGKPYLTTEDLNDFVLHGIGKKLYRLGYKRTKVYSYFWELRHLTVKIQNTFRSINNCKEFANQFPLMEILIDVFAHFAPEKEDDDLSYIGSFSVDRFVESLGFEPLPKNPNFYRKFFIRAANPGIEFSF